MLPIENVKQAKNKVNEIVNKLGINKSISSIGIGTENGSYAVIVQLADASEWIGWPESIQTDNQIEVPVVLKESPMPKAL